MKRALPVVALSLTLLSKSAGRNGSVGRKAEIRSDRSIGKLAAAETPVSVVVDVPTALANANV